jgi:AraC-like DNA-binding protein
MTIYRKEVLLSNHAFSRLQLIHAAFVDSYEVHARGHRMPVNRLLFICQEDAVGGSSIRDCDGGIAARMRAGHLYFIPCNHAVDLDLAPDLSFVSLQFHLDLFYGFDIMEAHARLETLEAPALVAELRDLMERETELGTLYRVNEIIYGLCARWAPSEAGGIQERLAKRRRYGRILDFVRKSGDAATTVAMLAGMSGMRRDVFSRRFARDMGIPPKDFISDTLTRKASEMLLMPGISVGKVAEELHFSSEFYFSHFFKRHTGMSPREYQRHNVGK